jgi:tetratricopeptide (TPR) repeat protein
VGDRKAAIDFYNAAVAAVNDKSQASNLQTGYSLFVSSCYADPTYWQSFYQNGNNNGDMLNNHASVASYRRALECDCTQEERAKVMTNLGWKLHTVGETVEALHWSTKATELDPALAYAWLNLSMIHGTLGDTAYGVQCARNAYAIDPDDPIVEMALAFALLFDRQFAAGLKHFEIRFKYKLHAFLQYPYPKWSGEEGKTIFLVADQGLGDTLSYARFVEAVCKRSAYVHACIQPELMRVFQHAFVKIPNLNLMPSPCAFPSADYWTTFVSQPFALGLSDKEYLEAPGIELSIYGLPKTWKVPDRKLHIGISYGGSVLNDIDKHRSIPVTKFLDLYKVPGIQLYSLQVGERAKDVHDTGSAALIKDISPYIRDVCDTFSLMRDLDLIITIESGLGHMAGAMGKETIIPYSWLGRDYRAGTDGSNPIWYPKHTFVQQDSSRNWDPVFEKIIEMVREKVDGMGEKRVLVQRPVGRVGRSHG